MALCTKEQTSTYHTASGHGSSVSVLLRRHLNATYTTRRMARPPRTTVVHVPRITPGRDTDGPPPPPLLEFSVGVVTDPDGVTDGSRDSPLHEIDVDVALVGFGVSEFVKDQIIVLLGVTYIIEVKQSKVPVSHG